ncbi:hypothetical protein FQZ97_970240 [compost metagenome]
MEMRGLRLEEIQCGLERLALYGDTGAADRGAGHHVRHGRAQDTAAVGQHPQGVVEAIQFVIDIAKRGGTQVGRYRAAPVGLLGPGENARTQALGLLGIAEPQARQGPHAFEDHGHVVITVLEMDRLLFVQPAGVIEAAYG